MRAADMVATGDARVSVRDGAVEIFGLKIPTEVRVESVIRINLRQRLEGLRTAANGSAASTIANVSHGLRIAIECYPKFEQTLTDALLSVTLPSWRAISLQGEAGWNCQE